MSCSAFTMGWAPSSRRRAALFRIVAIVVHVLVRLSVGGPVATAAVLLFTTAVRHSEVVSWR
jgi:hypothetical protein